MKSDEPSLLHWTAEDWWKYFNENKDMYNHLEMLLKRYDFIRTSARTNEHYPIVDAILSTLAKEITATLAKIQTENLFNHET